MENSNINRKCFGPAPVCIFALASLLYLPQALIGQGITAAILGLVTDQDGGAVQGAKILARSIQTNALRVTTTDYAGRFRIEQLALGDYEVQAERPGFSTEIRRGIVLTVGREAVLTFELKLGSITDRVVVSADASVVNTTTSEVSALINERTITELPLNGRDLLQLATLQLGVVRVSSLVDIPISTGTGAAKMSVNGARVTFNNYLLDGASVNEVHNTTPGSVAGGFTGVDTVGEFQVLTNNYSADFGGAGGGIVNIVSKSGSNEFHGRLFEFVRNSMFDARNFFDQGQVPAFRRNQFGGGFGGPLKRKRTFFYGGYEQLIQRLAQTNIFFVPDDAARLSASAAAAPYINLYPRPKDGDLGGGLALYIRSQSGPTSEQFVTGRVDHIFSAKDMGFARYTFDNSESITPDHVISNSVLRGRNQYSSLGETHLFSPNLLNTVRVFFNRSMVFGDLVDFVPVPQSLAWVPGVSVLGDFINIGGLTPLSDRTLVPRFLVLNSFEGSEQLVYSHGAHTLKAGFAVHRLQLNALSSSTEAGAFVFGSYKAFLNGKPQLFAAPLPGLNDAYRGIRTTMLAAYFQDDWKLRRNFTVNLGLRYEPTTGPSEVNGKIANLHNDLADTKPTVGSPFFQNETWRNFAARLGFAWDVTGAGHTSVRGGYGMFYTQLYPDAYRYQMSDQPPYFLLGLAFGPHFPGAYGQLQNVPGFATLQTYQYTPLPPYLQQWNLTVQRQLPGGSTVTAAYVGSRGVHLPTAGDVNTASDFTILPNGEKQFPLGVRNPLYNPAFGPIFETTDSGDSYYHAFQINLERRFRGGLQFQLAYTFSKSIDTSSDANHSYQLTATQYPQDIYDLRADRGLSVFDVRNNFALYVLYQLSYHANPGSTGVQKMAGLLFGGWDVTSIITARSGFPFNPIIGFNNSNDGNPNSVERPNWAPGYNAHSAVLGNPNEYFTPAAFTVAPAGQYGTVGRDVLTGPGLFSVDFSALKSHRITERFSLQFRAEAFNLLNRTNFSLPNIVTVATSDGVVPPNVGRITQTSTTSRQLQFGLKLMF